MRYMHASGICNHLVYPPKSEAQTQLPAWVMVDYTIRWTIDIYGWTYPQDLQILHVTAMQTACFNACLVVLCLERFYRC